MNYEKNKGFQVIMDFQWAQNDLSNTVLLASIFDILKESIKDTQLRIVAESIVYLPVPNTQSELGGTIFLQLDSSHISAHLYYETALLAIDVFGCGFTDIELVALYIENELRKLIPNNLERTYKERFIRFHHY